MLTAEEVYLRQVLPESVQEVTMERPARPPLLELIVQTPFVQERRDDTNESLTVFPPNLSLACRSDRPTVDCRPKRLVPWCQQPIYCIIPIKAKTMQPSQVEQGSLVQAS